MCKCLPDFLVMVIQFTIKQQLQHNLMMLLSPPKTKSTLYTFLECQEVGQRFSESLKKKKIKNKTQSGRSAKAASGKLSREWYFISCIFRKKQLAPC